MKKSKTKTIIGLVLTNTTTGWIYAWTTSKGRAEEIAAALNEKVRGGWRNK